MHIPHCACSPTIVQTRPSTKRPRVTQPHPHPPPIIHYHHSVPPPYVHRPTRYFFEVARFNLSPAHILYQGLRRVDNWRSYVTYHFTYPCCVEKDRSRVTLNCLRRGKIPSQIWWKETRALPRGSSPSMSASFLTLRTSTPQAILFNGCECVHHVAFATYSILQRCPYASGSQKHPLG